MAMSQSGQSSTTVAPLAGSVDRNINMSLKPAIGLRVAPLAGSVDRNFQYFFHRFQAFIVAPLAGSVDRNYVYNNIVTHNCVAPLAGSVDRNPYRFRHPGHVR